MRAVERVVAGFGGRVATDVGDQTARDSTICASNLSAWMEGFDRRALTAVGYKGEPAT